MPRPPEAPLMVLELTTSDGRPVRISLYDGERMTAHLPFIERWRLLRAVWGESPLVRDLVPIIDAAFAALKEEANAPDHR